MNKHNFKGKGGEPTHHLKPYSKKKKIEKMESPEEKLKSRIEKVVIKELKDVAYSKSYKCWHSAKSYSYEGSKLNVSDTFGGCGMQQLYGWRTIQDLQTAEILLLAYLKDRCNGVGLIMCQLGQTYYGGSFEQALVKCGFTATIEYKNYRHGSDGSYKQKVYTLQPLYKR